MEQVLYKQDNRFGCPTFSACGCRSIEATLISLLATSPRSLSSFPHFFAPLLPLLLVVSGANATDRLSVLESSLVRYGQFFATFCATCCQNLAAVGGSHSCAESVLVDSLAARWLECSLHCHNYLVFIVSAIFTVHTTPVDWVLCGVQRYNLFLILQSICRNFIRF